MYLINMSNMNELKEPLLPSAISTESDHRVKEGYKSDSPSFEKSLRDEEGFRQP
jgi:hypothetical protein